VDVILLLGVDERHNVPPQKPQGHESLLAIAETVILVRIGDALENLFGINKIETMFLEIDTPFSVIPGNHHGIVYTDGICVKEKALRGPTAREFRLDFPEACPVGFTSDSPPQLSPVTGGDSSDPHRGAQVLLFSIHKTVWSSQPFRAPDHRRAFVFVRVRSRVGKAEERFRTTTQGD
jgi:hypothetical protein